MRVDKVQARETLMKAVALAKSDTALPTEWEAHSVALRADAMPTTYTPFVFTALLAKATNPAVDALSIKAAAGPRGYSARSLAKDVVVPVAQEVGIDLRTKGPEPLNNQPFFAYSRVDAIDRSKDSGALDYLLSALRRVECLDAPQALLALAAFVRTGIKHFDGERIPYVVAARGLAQLLPAVEEFLAENPEGGQRAQAVVAAAMSCVFTDVRTGLVNDPSRHLPGDVVVYGRRDNPILSIEVRAKLVTPADAERFRSRLMGAGVLKALVVALAAQQAPFDYDSIVDLGTGETAPTLQVVVGPVDLLATAATWSPTSVDQFASNFPKHLAERLLQVGAPRSTVSRWARLTYDFREG
ncbi:MAG: restriction endonuclease, SacI family [Coriobacteriia bacterium]|nr:restriction endonuclease, SacI family [Coriobacteriia bacterium]